MMVMILTIDTTALDADSSESYAAWRGDNVEVQLDGKPLVEFLRCCFPFVVEELRELRGVEVVRRLVGEDAAHEDFCGFHVPGHHDSRHDCILDTLGDVPLGLPNSRAGRLDRLVVRAGRGNGFGVHNMLPSEK